MHPERARTRPKRSGVEKEEERTWVGLYRQARRDAGVATEVLAQLEADIDSRRTHLALYLCCRRTLREHKARQQRNRRTAQWLRRCLEAVVDGVASASRRLVDDVHDIATEFRPSNRRSDRQRMSGRSNPRAMPAMTRTPDVVAEAVPISKVA